jgi:hypothetical protein
MIIESGALEFFDSLPDEVLVEIALNDWPALISICSALSIDLQLLKENPDESISYRRNLC